MKNNSPEVDELLESDVLASIRKAQDMANGFTTENPFVISISYNLYSITIEGRHIDKYDTYHITRRVYIPELVSDFQDYTDVLRKEIYTVVAACKWWSRECHLL